MSHERHNHPMSPEELAAKAVRRTERVQEGHRKQREGHEHLENREQLWSEFWAQADKEGLSDPPGPVRDELIHHYGMHRFLEKRYVRSLRRGKK